MKYEGEEEEKGQGQNAGGEAEARLGISNNFENRKTNTQQNTEELLGIRSLV